MSNDTRLRILQAAREEFSKHGFSGVTTRQLAEKAQVNEVTIFRYFKNKYNLFAEVFEHFLFTPNFSFSEEDLQKAPGDFLYDVGVRLYSVFLENKSMIKIELKNDDMKLKNRISKFPNALKTELESFLHTRLKMDSHSAEFLSINFIAFLFGLFMNIEINQNFNVDYRECIKKMVDSLI